MASVQNRKEMIGYIPAHCFQCQEGVAHEVLRLMSYKRGVFNKSKEVEFGHVSKCTQCGMFTPASEEVAAVCLAEPPALIQESACELFGESNAVEHWDTELKNIQLGLTNESGRLDAICAVYASVSEHISMPTDVLRDQRSQDGKNRIKVLVWFVGVISIVLFDLFMIPGGESYWPAFVIVTSVVSVVWTAIMFGKPMDPNAVNELVINSRLKDAKKRLARGLGVIGPTGHELKMITDFAAENRMWTAMVEPHDVLMQIKLDEKDASSVRSAAA